LIVLGQDNFSPQIVDVGPTGKDKVFSLIVEKNDYYDQPMVKLIKGNNAVKCALYRQCTGGGNSFVLAVGDTEDSISIASVKKHQLYGEMQAFERVFWGKRIWDSFLVLQGEGKYLSTSFLINNIVEDETNEIPLSTI